MAWKPKPAAQTKPVQTKPTSQTVKPRTIGSRQLARDSGYAQAHVSRMMLKGMTPAEIRRKGAERQALSASAKKGSVIDKRAHVERHAEMHGTPSPRHTPGRVPTAVNGEDLRHAQTRKEIALADQREMENAARRGELVPRVQVEIYISEGIVKCKDVLLKLDELGDRFAQMEPPKIRETIRAEVHRALGEIQAAWQKLVDMAQEPVLDLAGGLDDDEPGDDE